MKKILSCRVFSLLKKILVNPVSALLPLLAIPSLLHAESSPDISGGVTATYQSSKEGYIRSELTFSADLVMAWQLEKDEFYIYLEGNSSPLNNGISSILPEANADAGSALDKDRKGRIQISEIGYRLRLSDRQTLSMGLLDVTAYFDQSRIASDENTQFMGVSFVQNPTIEFPDYTLGVVYENLIDSNTAFRAAILSSNGIADNPNLSYTQLLDVHENGKGLFSIAAITKKNNNWLFRGGTWVNSADHESLDSSQKRQNNYGGYLLLGYQQGRHGINFRAGGANPDVSITESFAGVSYQYRRAPWIFGAAAAQLFLSSQILDKTMDDTTQYETYLRYQINQKFFITGDLQHLKNSNFNNLNVPYDNQQMLYGLRFTYLM